MMPGPVRKPRSVLRVAQALRRARGIGLQRRLERAGEDAGPQAIVEPGADAHQDLRAQRVEQRQDADRQRRDQRQHDQRVTAATRQHTIEHLHHVERRCQHQHIDRQTEHHDHAECASAGPQCFFDVAQMPVHRPIPKFAASNTACQGDQCRFIGSLEVVEA